MISPVTLSILPSRVPRTPNKEVEMRMAFAMIVAVGALGFIAPSAYAGSTTAPDVIGQAMLAQHSGDSAASRGGTGKESDTQTSPGFDNNPAVRPAPHPLPPNGTGTAAGPHDPTGDMQNDRNNSGQGASGHSGDTRSERNAKTDREREMDRAYNR
jgi:hypothetical protein